MVGGDVSHYHAYAEIYLNGRWVKSTPLFNRKLCHLFGVDPLEFDGTTEATLQPYDKKRNRYIECIRHHGTFEEFPYQQCVAHLQLHHPRLFKDGYQTVRGNLARERSIETTPLYVEAVITV